MAGVVLETLSNRKLLILGGFMLLLQIVFFLIGGLVAPKPSNVQQVLATKCVDKHLEAQKNNKALYSRGEGSCEKVQNFKEAAEKRITANEIVFTFQLPLPRNNEELTMSRWFQHIISVLYVDVEDDENVPVVDEGYVMTMDAYLGYRNKDDDPDKWTEIVKSTENRTIVCERMTRHDHDHEYPSLSDNFSAPASETHQDTILQCDILPLFELGSCHYDYYLINIRIPIDEEKNMNVLVYKFIDLHMVAIHQNGGFTIVWLSIKTFVFPLLMATLIWFWKRIASLERPPRLIEKTLFALGLSLSFLNLPVEWMTLWFHMPFMLLLSDIRQGIFYSILLCFWIIFAGEHMMDQVERNRLVIYWRHLAGVVFGCICLFVFEMCERGVQMTNPFHNVWVTETGQRLALAFIILAGISACIYFLFLCSMVYRVYRNISAKKSSLPSMNKTRRKFYMGLIYRFKFLMLATLVCAAVTVIFFIISQVSEGHWKWDDEGQKLEYTSAFFTGVYGMWNIYVFSLLVLYAPSHKYMKVLDTDTVDEHDEGYVMTMDAYLGYRNKDDDPDKWTEIVKSTENRTIVCERMTRHDHEYPSLSDKFLAPASKIHQDTILQCDILPLFELGSCHYDYYLINIRIPIDEEKNMNVLVYKFIDLHMVAIHQNGGFTIVWLSIKTFVFPLLMATLIWFWRRIASLERPPRLIEKTLFALGLSLSFLNLPVEWMTLWFHMPFMLLLSDIRQGIFYSILLCFWIIFAGEHMMDQTYRNRLVIYWRHLAAVLFGCVSFFVFKIVQRAFPLNNPFHMMEASAVGQKLALAFIILAGILACVYFIFLCSVIYRVFRNMSVPLIDETRRKFYLVLIVLMLFTLVCAAATVIFFLISQFFESIQKRNDMAYSAFLSGVYGMWNIYVFTLMVLFSPVAELNKDFSKLMNYETG